MNKLNLVGQKIGKLLVLKESKQIGYIRNWLCQCDCGKKCIVRQDSLRKRNGAKSCGCLLSTHDGKIVHDRTYRLNYYKNETAKYRLTINGFANLLLSNARKTSRKQNIEYTITINDILTILKNGYCQISGIKFIINNVPREPFAPSIDRINPNKGYTPENIQIVCWIYNSAKGVNTHTDVLKLSRALLKPKINHQHISKKPA